MPRKKPPTISLPIVINAAADLRRPWKENGALVRVNAIYHVPSVHPSDDGPWSSEADKIAWTDALTGYGCIIRRSPEGHHLCGYVSVPQSHPLFGRHVGTITGIMIGVHGGLDYSDACDDDGPEDSSICHVVPVDFQHQVYRENAAGHDSAWWFGFSCNQRTDIVPDDHRRACHPRLPRFGIDEPTYRSEAFVYGECVRLAAQLKAIEQNRDPRSADPGSTTLTPSDLEFTR